MNNYYKTLQVDPEASQEIIEAAYRRLAKIHHPDLSKSQQAPRKMQQINEAYGVLKDPIQRSRYDTSLRPEYSGAEGSSPPPNRNNTSGFSGASYSTRTASADIPPDFPVHCDRCGISDGSLRLASFPYVFSLVLVTFRRKRGGVYCRQCRRREMRNAKLRSFFFGWWGIPFGIFWTLGILFKPSEGEVPRGLNAEYLRGLGAYFLGQGNRTAAERALAASIHYKFDRELDNLFRRLFQKAPKPNASVRHGGRNGILAGMGAIAAIIIIVVLIGNIGGANGATNQNEYSGNSIGSDPDSTLPAVIANVTPTASEENMPVKAATTTPAIPPLPSVAEVDNIQEPNARPSFINGPTAAVNTDQLNIRSGPGLEYPILGRVQKREVLAIVEQYENCSWLHIFTADGKKGWVADKGKYVSRDAPCNSIPRSSMQEIPSTVQVRPATSSLGIHSTSKGAGELLIENGTEMDGSVVLTTPTGDLTASAYIRAGESFQFVEIPDGQYMLYFSHGDKWDSATNRFTENVDQSRYLDTFDFITADNQYTVWEATLHTVWDGNAPTLGVTLDDYPTIP